MNKYTINDPHSYCLGMSLTIEALKHKAEYVKEIFLSEKAQKNSQLEYLLSLADKYNIKVTYDDKVIDKLSNKENCYCIGVFNKFETYLDNDNHIVLYKFNDYGELGTIIRSCISFDYKNIVLIDCDLDYFDPRCIRASMGSFFLCNISRYDSLDSYLSKYKKNTLYPFVSNSEEELSSIILKEPYSIIISQDYYGIDNKFTKDYSLKHNDDSKISLSIRSSIILQHFYDLKRSL